MSTRQRLAEAAEALPDSLTIEEAVERLYRAFKLKQALNREEPAASRKVAVADGFLKLGEAPHG